jgi:cellulose synthase/poly-beta-1,6-N-acetylglucosamine synthase-like glycosyltransferase
VIEVVDVVVPAHDEERDLADCVAALRAAAAHPDLAEIEVRIAIVLDSCSDRSGDVAERALQGCDDAPIVECRVRSAGAARAVGTRLLLAEDAGRDPAAIWIATTDADTRVTRDWLALQVAAARAGADAVAGVVEVDDWSQQPRVVRHRFLAHYASLGTAAGHGHVHGANLGVRASALAAAGGMPTLALAEDHALVDDLAATGAVILRSGDVRVRTSARREARAAGGFGDLLHRLET